MCRSRGHHPDPQAKPPGKLRKDDCTSISDRLRSSNGKFLQLPSLDVLVSRIYRRSFLPSTFDLTEKFSVSMKLPKYFAKESSNAPAFRPLENPFLGYLSELDTPKTEFVSSNSRSSQSNSTQVQRSAHDELEIVPFVYTTTGSSKSAASSSSSSSYTRPGSSVSSMDAGNEALVEAFRVIDRNGDGKISLQDLDFMWRSMGKKLSKKELRIMLKDADKDGDGELNLEEFLSIHREDDSTNYADEIQVAFNVFDVDRNNHISAQELRIVMKRIGKRKTTLADCSAMIQFVDSDGDGQLHFEDFERLMLSSRISAY